jgi:ceramide glucosyltransferase
VTGPSVHARANGVTTVWLICTALATIGCGYALYAAACVRSWGKLRPQPAGASPPSVSILKPLCGAEPGLLANLGSFTRQDYAGDVEIIFGVQDAADPAVPVVADLIAGEGAIPIPMTLRLVIDTALHGPNRKVSNLVNLAKVASGDIIVLADSDMRVGPGYLAAVTGALRPPGVGLVTCLYRGEPLAGRWSCLSGMAIDHHFLPSVLVGLRLGLAKPCFGSTIALRRDTLARIGGFEAFAGYLADDYAVGAAVRKLGFDVAIPPIALDHICCEDSFAAMLAHELRWTRTIRRVDPLGYAGTVVTHAIPFALITLLLTPGRASVGLLLAALACRRALQIQVDRVLGRSLGGPWWGPIRDVLSFAVFVASFWSGAVSWRGRSYRVRRDGTLVLRRR